MFLPDSFTFRNAAICVAAAARQRLPAIYPFDAFTLRGGLISYTGAREETAALIASYLDLILRGADVAELPVQFSRSFELVINRKVAEALGGSTDIVEGYDRVYRTGQTERTHGAEIEASRKPADIGGIQRLQTID